MGNAGNDSAACQPPRAWLWCPPARQNGGAPIRPKPDPDKTAIKRQENGKMVEVGGVAADRLRSFIERIERLEEEKKALAEDIREVYSEAKGAGFDIKVMRQLIKLRKMDNDDRSEMEAILDVYERALGA
jgi:uncharacterized protein (UPF0335 family)